MKKNKKVNLNFISYSFHRISAYDKKILIFTIMYTILSVGISFITILFPKVLVDLITQEAELKIEKIIMSLGLLTILLAIFYFLNEYALQEVKWRKNNINQGVSRDLFYKSLECDYQYFDKPEIQQLYVRLQKNEEQESSYGKVLFAVSAIVTGVSGLFLYSFILTKLSFLLVLLLIINAIITFSAYEKATKFEYKKNIENTHLDKKINYVLKTSYQSKYGKDIRLYHMKQLFFDQKKLLFEQKHNADFIIKKRYFYVDLIKGITSLLRDGAAYAFLIYQVLKGSISIGDFLLFFGAIAGFSGFITKIMENINILSRTYKYIEDIITFLEGDIDFKINKQTEIADKLDNKKVNIEFQNVSFSYDKKKPVISDFSINIKSGEKIAIVGINGAGKTTLIKLLCGLYTPDEGKIYINRKEVSEYSKEELFSFFSPVFQDIFIPPFTIAQNISCHSEYKPEEVENALKKAGLWNVVEDYEEGIDTSMTKVVDPKGAVMSGGEQQKLFLARALYKDAPCLLLDEPTAALDPLAENEIYEKYNYLTLDKTSIFISHRLASTRFCDRIVLLNNGRVEEIGTHEELLMLKGLYSEMFEMQSEHYREEKIS